MPESTLSDGIDLRVALGERPLTLNAERDLHWAQAAKVIAEWKRVASLTARSGGLARARWERARFTFRPVYPDGRAVPDTGAIYPVEKAIVDALVELGVIPDDNRFHNAGQLSLPPMVDSSWQSPAVLVRVSPHPADLGHGYREQCGCQQAREASQLENDRRAARGR